MRRDTLVDWIEEKAEGELIEGVAIGDMGWGDYQKEIVPNYEEQPKGKLLSWEDAKPYLNYKFYSGYGAPECNAVYAWTPTKVIFISQYDGATCPEAIPRHPVACVPYMPGG